MSSARLAAALPIVLRTSSRPGHVALELAPLVEDANFRGHFPGHPILPGIVQIGWIVHFAQHHFGTTQPFRELASIKFHRVIQPGAMLTIEIDLDAKDGALRFRFLDRAGSLSSGILRP